MKQYSLATRKFGASAAMACLGMVAMVLFPWDIVVYTVGPATMMCIIVILLFGKDKKVVA